MKAPPVARPRNSTMATPLLHPKPVCGVYSPPPPPSPTRKASYLVLKTYRCEKWGMGEWDDSYIIVYHSNYYGLLWIMMDYYGLLGLINYCGLLWVIPTFLTKRKKNHTLKNNELHCFGRAKVLAQVLFEHGLVLLPSLATREPGIGRRKVVGDRQDDTRIDFHRGNSFSWMVGAHFSSSRGMWGHRKKLLQTCFKTN